MNKLNKLLIANRGEIALRILRAARDLGIATVAIHSRDDADLPHLELADERVALDASGPGAYLDIAAIVDAASRTGCDAVHPGYGFLSERPEFAAACARAGLVFVGPTVAQLELFGDKAAAIDHARQCGVPVMPSTRGGATLAEIEAFFDVRPDIVIKAVGGGGGRAIVRRQRLHPHPRGAAVAIAQLDRGGVAEVDDAALVERAAVVDPHHHRAAVVEVGHPREAGQRQGLVGGGEGVHVVHLLAGGAATVELVAVIGGQALLDVACVVVQHPVLLAQHGVIAVAGARTRLGTHLGLGNRIDVGNLVRHRIGDARAEQAAGHVVAALGQVFLRRRVGRDPARRGRDALGGGRVDRLARRCIRRGAAGRTAAGGGAGRQRQRQHRTQQARPRAHAPPTPRPAMASAS